jgi:hypothetical protein
VGGQQQQWLVMIEMRGSDASGSQFVLLLQ